MPTNLTIAIFVLGAVMLLLGLVSGGFKIFGSEIPGVANRTARVIAFVIGAGLVGFALFHFQTDNGPKPNPGPNPPTPTPVVDGGDGNGGGGGKPKPPEPAPAPPKAAENLNDPSAVRTFAHEAYDYSVPPRNSIEPNVSSPTPMTIPGAKTITTGELSVAMRSGRPFLLVDVLEAPHQGLPGARRYPGVGMGYPSADLASLLEKDTHGDKAYPVVFYCGGAACWESYNAALRARDAGYSNVYWYRGGLEAWAMASQMSG